MKGIFGFFLVVVASHSATALAQPWERFELKDEMRGTVTHSASIKSTAAGDENVTLVMQVVDKGRNEQGIVFQLSGGAIACDEHM